MRARTNTGQSRHAHDGCGVRGHTTVNHHRIPQSTSERADDRPASLLPAALQPEHCRASYRRNLTIQSPVLRPSVLRLLKRPASPARLPPTPRSPSGRWNAAVRLGAAWPSWCVVGSAVPHSRRAARRLSGPGGLRTSSPRNRLRPSLHVTGCPARRPQRLRQRVALHTQSP